MTLLEAVLALALVAVLGFGFFETVRGTITLDLGWGRTFHALGPIEVAIDAPRELVFQTVSGPYLGRTPKGMRDHLEVIDAGEDWALAAHYTEFALYTATTVELVRFEAPELVHFRQLRGPVPAGTETFELTDTDDGGTVLRYTGELGMDFWAIGRLLARTWVVPTWEDEVRGSLERTRESAERRAEARARRGERAADEE